MQILVMVPLIPQSSDFPTVRNGIQVCHEEAAGVVQMFGRRFIFHFPEISPGYFHLKIYPCTIKNRMVSKGSQVRSGTGWESEPSEGDWIYVLCTELPTFMSPAKRIKWQVMGKAFTYDSERQILVPADIWLYEPTVWLIWKGLHEENFVQRQDRRDKMGNKIIWMPFSYITTKQGNFL